MKKTIAICLLFLLPVIAVAQEYDFKKMNAYFDAVHDHEKSMGSISIFKDGQEVYARAIGYANVEKEVKNTLNTKFRIGSISKMYTAVLIFQLIEKGKLTLETPLSHFYPNVVQSDKITIRHLLKHQSGLFNFTNDPDYLNWMEQSITKEALLKKINSHEAVFTPGEKSEYSNTNYILLTYIIEDITKKSFKEVLRKKIIKPLKLKNTYYGEAIGTNENEAFSYQKTMGWMPATETDMSVPLGAGAIVSSPKEVNVFLNALFQHKLVSEKSLEEMKNLEDGYGAAMFAYPFYEHTSYGHSGGIDGFVSITGYFPDENMSVTYLSNGTEIPTNDIIIAALSIYFDSDFDIPTFETIVLPEEALLPFKGAYSSDEFPLKITVTVQEGKLFAQAEGQSAFPLDALDENNFEFTPAGIQVEFIADKNQMFLTQGGKTYTYTKE